MTAELDQCIRLLADLMLDEDGTPVRVGRDPKWKGHRRDLLNELRTRDHADLIEDVEFMVANGENPERVAHRVGMKRESLVRQLERVGRRDLARIIDQPDRRRVA